MAEAYDRRRTLACALANAVQARINCVKSGNHEWEPRWRGMVEQLTHEHMPSGGGFDSGTKFDWEKSTGEKLVFHTSFHHMDDVGMYDGWTEHTVTVRGSLTSGFVISISGRDRNEIKDMIHDCFSVALSRVDLYEVSQ